MEPPLDLSDALMALATQGCWTLTCRHCSTPHTSKLDGATRRSVMLCTSEPLALQAARGGPNQPLDDLQVGHIPADQMLHLARWADRKHYDVLIASDDALFELAADDLHEPALFGADGPDDQFIASMRPVLSL